VSDSLALIPKKTLKLLKESKIVTPTLIAEILTQSAHVSAWLSSARILDLLYEENPTKFSDTISDALDEDLLDLKDTNMIKALALIMKENECDVHQICNVLQSFCEHTNTFAACGVFLRRFCTFWGDDKDMDKVQLIIDGKVHKY
jgi:hypothetical protein